MSLPADPSSLGLEALAHGGDYTALAALVHHTDAYDAFGALASSGREPEALRWVVALLATKLPPAGYQPHEQAEQQAYVGQLDDNLPENLRVPGELRDEMKEFVLTPPTPPTAVAAGAGAGSRSAEP